MKILFIVPPSPEKRRIVRMIDCSYESKAMYLWQPNDYMMISSRLSARDEAELIDGTADAMDEIHFFRHLERIRPDLVFFALSSTCWSWDYRIFQKVRKIYESVPMYLIGDVFLEDNYLEFILPHCEGVVYIPYLLDLEKMADNRQRGNTGLPGLRKMQSSEEGNLKRPLTVSSGMPRHELFLRDGYVFPFARHFRFTTITTFWGCPFSCYYCNQRGIAPVIRDVMDVLRELEYVKGLGVKELFFADKAFGYPPASAMTLLEEMKARFSFSWSCYFHPQMYRPELLDKMHEAGCHTIIVGLDSADLAGLRQYGRNVEPERVDKLLEHANRLGMDICADFIIGLEHEKEEDIIRSIDYALTLPVDFASFNIAAPLPGSGIREKAVGTGSLVFGHEGFDTLARAGVLVNSGVNKDRILELRSEAVRRFYLRPAYLLRRLKKTESPEHFMIQMRQMIGLLKKS